MTLKEYLAVSACAGAAVFAAATYRPRTEATPAPAIVVSSGWVDVFVRDPSLQREAAPPAPAQKLEVRPPAPTPPPPAAPRPAAKAVTPTPAPAQAAAPATPALQQVCTPQGCYYVQPAPTYYPAPQYYAPQFQAPAYSAPRRRP